MPIKAPEMFITFDSSQPRKIPRNGLKEIITFKNTKVLTVTLFKLAKYFRKNLSIQQ